MKFQAIAQHLNASEVIEVREWARVLWVKALVAGKAICRFVSKKVNTMSKKEIEVEGIVWILSDNLSCIDGRFRCKDCGRWEYAGKEIKHSCLCQHQDEQPKWEKERPVPRADKDYNDVAYRVRKGYSTNDEERYQAYRLGYITENQAMNSDF